MQKSTATLALIGEPAVAELECSLLVDFVSNAGDSLPGQVRAAPARIGQKESIEMLRELVRNAGSGNAVYPVHAAFEGRSADYVRIQVDGRAEVKVAKAAQQIRSKPISGVDPVCRSLCECEGINRRLDCYARGDASDGYSLFVAQANPYNVGEQTKAAAVGFGDAQQANLQIANGETLTCQVSAE